VQTNAAPFFYNDNLFISDKKRKKKKQAMHRPALQARVACAGKKRRCA
jgi:hypothetical protein